jgi:hypothetical protein
MVTKVSSTVGLVLIWLVTVAGVSATAWFAIDRAGRNITGGGSEVNPASVGTALATTTPPTSPSATPNPGSSSPQPRSPSPQPGTSSPQPGTSGSPTPRSTAPQTGTTDTPTRRDRSISVAGGQVSVRCTGATILLRIAQPDNGWRVEVKESGPGEVKARFEGGSDNSEDSSERETRVEAVCVNGAPAFTVENHG